MNNLATFLVSGWSPWRPWAAALKMPPCIAGVPPQACSAGVPPVIVLRSPAGYRRDAGATSGARDARSPFSSFLCTAPHTAL